MIEIVEQKSCLILFLGKYWLKGDCLGSMVKHTLLVMEVALSIVQNNTWLVKLPHSLHAVYSENMLPWIKPSETDFIRRERSDVVSGCGFAPGAPLVCTCADRHLPHTSTCNTLTGAATHPYMLLSEERTERFGADNVEMPCYYESDDSRFGLVSHTGIPPDVRKPRCLVLYCITARFQNVRHFLIYTLWTT